MCETNLNQFSEAKKARLLCYYHYKETGEFRFSMNLVAQLMQNAGFNNPNSSRLKEKLTKGTDKIFLCVKNSKCEYEFIPAILQMLEEELGIFWKDTDIIESSSDLFEEAKFCGKRKYIDRLIKQINHTYINNCYDACAVIMRRLFEVLLVLSYENLMISDAIKSTDGRYFMLEKIVQNAKGNKILNLPLRICNELDTIREVGNLSAHNITYTAGKKDIDDIKLSYRVMLEELFNKAGLM